MTTEVKHHHDVSERLIAHARGALRDGDMIQASEKAWGAVAHLVRSVAEERGWRQQSHRDLHRNALAIIRSTDDARQNRVRLGVANGLHQNFYNDNYDTDMVRDSLGAVEELLDALQEARGRLR